MHTKGSYHSYNGSNDVWRRFLMKAILSKPCFFTVMPKTCNVCSARFSPLPYPHTSGNFFVSTCEYIRRLVPPCRFQAALDSMVAQAPVEPQPNRNLWDLGLWRFAAEHWVHSHPTVSPCDVYEGPWVWHLQTSGAGAWEPRLRPAPRFDLHKYKLHLEYDRESLFLWRCYEWSFLYSQLPPASSFWWRFYASGKRRVAAVAN